MLAAPCSWAFLCCSTEWSNQLKDQNATSFLLGNCYLTACSISPQLDQEEPPPSSTLMALREPLNSMLCEETKVQTGLSCARIVFTFCRF